MSGWYVLVGVLLAGAGLMGAGIYFARKAAVSDDDLDEARKAQKVQERADRAMEQDRKQNEDL